MLAHYPASFLGKMSARIISSVRCHVISLTIKLQSENKLCRPSIMVTSGSNQGFLNLVLALCDVSDSVVLFAPYFFNAYMAFRMTGISNIIVGPSDPESLLPDAVVCLRNVQGYDSNRKEFYEQEQRFQKQHKQYDARLEAEIKAASQQQREKWRKAQRRMLKNMKKLVFFDDDYTSLRELESLIGDCSTRCAQSVRWHTPALKRSSSDRCTSPLRPLEQHGLFIKEEYDFDDDDDGMVLDGLEEGELLPQ